MPNGGIASIGTEGRNRARRGKKGTRGISERIWRSAAGAGEFVERPLRSARFVTETHGVMAQCPGLGGEGGGKTRVRL